jgi:hypothetical protein
MRHNSEAIRARGNWMTLPEIVTHITDKNCTVEDARQQIRVALSDGALPRLRWEHPPTIPPGNVGGETAEQELAPRRRHKHWQLVHINWETGRVLDDFDLTAEALERAKWRRLLIHRINVRAVWDPPADPFQDPDLYEAQSALLAEKAREARDAKDAAAEAAWATEFRKPMQQRQIFSFVEIANALARKPGRLEVDHGEHKRVLLDLENWIRRGEFNFASDGDVMVLVDDPPFFEPFSPLPQGAGGLIIIIHDRLVLGRHACRRYIEVNLSLANAPRVLGEWFPENETYSHLPASHAVPASESDRPPLSGRALESALEKWVVDQWGTYFNKLPDREELLKRARKEVSAKVTEHQVRALRRKYAPDHLKRGGAGYTRIEFVTTHGW